MKKSIIALVMILSCFIFSTTANAADKSINLIINGKTVAFTDDSGYPYIDENHRTMVPLRVTMESTGAAIGFDKDKQTAIVIMEYERIEVPIGTDYLYDNNLKIQNDTVSVATNGRTYLPIRAVLESAGYTVEWSSDTNSVIAYNFAFDDNALVPYHTGSLETLIDQVLAGNVVYINGQYYATPDYVKLLANTKINYLGDDLNIAIYPQNSRFDFADYEPDLPPESPSEDLDGIS